MVWISFALTVLFIVVVIFVLPSLWECASKTKDAQAAIRLLQDKVELFSKGIDLQKLENDRREIISQGISEVERHVTELFEKLDKESRCPKCRGICKSQAKFCPHCGEDFFKEKEATVDARVLSSYGGPETDLAFTIDWECLACDDQHSEEFDDEDLDGRGVFICPLKCSSCDEYCGEVVVDSNEDPIKLSQVFLPGQFDLSNAVAAFDTLPKKEEINAKANHRRNRSSS